MSIQRGSIDNVNIGGTPLYEPYFRMIRYFSMQYGHQKTVKKPMPSPPRHSKQSSGEASSSEQRSNDSGLQDREKSSRKPRKKDDRSSRHRNKGDRHKR